jgi:hypothetical protein
MSSDITLLDITILSFERHFPGMEGCSRQVFMKQEVLMAGPIDNCGGPSQLMVCSDVK